MIPHIRLGTLMLCSVAALQAQTFSGPRSGPAPALDATAPGGGLSVGTFPGITERQMFYYQQVFNIDFQMVDLAVTNARTELISASLKVPRDDAAIAAAVTKLAGADAAAAAKKAESL